MQTEPALLVSQGDGWRLRAARFGVDKVLEMDGIACAPGLALQCTATGDIHYGSQYFSLILTSAGALQAAKAPNTLGAGAIACPSLRFCLAGGFGIDRYEFPASNASISAAM